MKTTWRSSATDDLRAFSRLTELVGGEPRIINDPPLIVPIETFVSGAESDRIVQSILSSFRAYRHRLLYDRRLLLEGLRHPWTRAQDIDTSGERDY